MKVLNEIFEFKYSYIESLIIYFVVIKLRGFYSLIYSYFIFQIQLQMQITLSMRMQCSNELKEKIIINFVRI